ncbi:MAG TPA: hypothetical protein VM260_21235, partial [Pirellula sp.]|nr:hypothetical protein [Pirellula sp.]
MSQRIGRPSFNPHNRLLRIESLETRANPVTAGLSGTTLIINGDEFIHDIIGVRQTLSNTIEVHDGR